MRADARKLPVEDRKADFVFLDPPYSDHIEYSPEPDCIGKISATDPRFMDEMEKVVRECHRVLRNDRYLGLYICDYFNKREGFVPNGFPDLRAPAQMLPARGCGQRRAPQQIAQARQLAPRGVENNFYLRGFNYLFIMKKEEEKPLAGRGASRAAHRAGRENGLLDPGRSRTGKTKGGSHERFPVFGFVALGLLAGFCSGLLGIGGAAIIIPILVMAFGFTQHSAQGTTLVLLSLPLGLIPAWQYYRAGKRPDRGRADHRARFCPRGLFSARGSALQAAPARAPAHFRRRAAGRGAALSFRALAGRGAIKRLKNPAGNLGYRPFNRTHSRTANHGSFPMSLIVNGRAFEDLVPEEQSRYIFSRPLSEQAELITLARNPAKIVGSLSPSSFFSSRAKPTANTCSS